MLPSCIYHPAVETACPLPLRLTSSLSHCSPYSPADSWEKSSEGPLGVISLPVGANQPLQFCLEHKNSPHPHLPSPLEHYPPQDNTPSGHWTSGALTQHASQRASRAGSSRSCKHPKNSSTAQNTYNSSCKAFDSYLNLPPSVLSGEALTWQPGMLGMAWHGHGHGRALLCLPVSRTMSCWICWLCYSRAVFAPTWQLHPNQINTRILLQRKWNKAASIVNEKSGVFGHLSFP